MKVAGAHSWADRPDVLIVDIPGNFPHYEFRTNPYRAAAARVKRNAKPTSYEDEDQTPAGSLRPACE